MNFDYQYFDQKIVSNLEICNIKSTKPTHSLHPTIQEAFIRQERDNPVLPKLDEAYWYDAYLNSVSQKLGYTPNYPVIGQYKFAAFPSSDMIQAINDTRQNDFHQSLFNKPYPIAVRYTDNRNIYLIERPPFRANITYRSTRSYSRTTKERSFEIWIPWTYMILYMDPKSSYYQSSLFFNDGPIQSFDDPAVPCFFPNMYEDGRMCLNQTSVMLQQYLAEINSYDLSSVYNFIFNDYMTGGWNLDLGISVFDKAVAMSDLASKHRSAILKGNGTKAFPEVSPNYNGSYHPKYVNNFLTYFSNLSLQEILDIVTSLKNSKNKMYAYGSNSSKGYPKISEVINNISKENNYSFDFLFSYSNNISYRKFIVNSDIYILNSVYTKLLDYENNSDFCRSLILNIQKLILDLNSSEFDSMLNSTNFYHFYNNHKLTDIIFVEDYDNIYLFQSKDVDYYSNLFTSNSQLVNS